MAQVSNIEWTDTTWNPIVGCAKVSAGCKNCYAERMAARLKAMALAATERGANPGRKAAYVSVINDRKCWTGSVALVEEALRDPVRLLPVTTRLPVNLIRPAPRRTAMQDRTVPAVGGTNSMGSGGFGQSSTIIVAFSPSAPLSRSRL